jgi:hypothetical protein
MDSLSPFPQGSFIPYNMPVYPGAQRATGIPSINFSLASGLGDKNTLWKSTGPYIRYLANPLQ